MNYWSLRSKSEETLTQKVQKFIFKHVDVESNQRNKFESFMVFVNYMISYVIIFSLIMQSLAREFTNKVDRSTIIFSQRLPHGQITDSVYQSILVLFLVRIGLALLYIGFQKVYILIVGKILLLINLYLTEKQTSTEDFLAVEIPLLLLELLAFAVWSYKIQNRIVHFDSRLDAMKPFFKEVLVVLASFFMRRLQKSSFSERFSGHSIPTIKFSIFEIEAMQLLIAVLLFITFIDFLDVIYKRDFKRILLGLDMTLSALLTSWIVCIKLTGKNAIYTNYLMLFVSLIGMQLILLFSKDDFGILYQIEGKKLQYLSENKLIEYFQTLRRLIKEEDGFAVEKNIELIKFIEFHKRSCLYPACPFTKRFNMEDSVFLKSQLVQEYIIKILEEFCKTRPKIKAYLIFFLSPRDKVFRYLSGEFSYMRREIWRISQIKREMSNEIRILEAEMVLKKSNSLIQEYLACGKKYFETLMKEHVNGENLVLYGGRMLDLIGEIEKMKENSINFTQSVRILLNNFSSRLIQDEKTLILQNVVDPPFLINRTTEVGPTLILSAEPENFLKVIDANIACTKEFYYPKEVFLSLSAIDLLPEQIKVKHLEHFEKVSKKTDFDGKKDFPTSIFVVNKNGFMSFFTAVIYLLNSIKGRMWCVSAQITHKMDAILLIAMEKNGVVMGISEMAVFHGLKTTDKGKELTEKFYRKIRTKQSGSNKYKSVTIESHEKLFMDDDFEFGSQKELNIVEEFSSFGLTYYLVDIKSMSEVNSIKKYQIEGTQKEIEEEKTSINNVNSALEMNYVPKNQYFYHSDGVVRKFEESQASIETRFPFETDKNSTIVEIKGELHEGISQMLLVKDKLDYLQNIEKEKEFMSRPITQMEKRDQQLKNFNLSLDLFKESLQAREQTAPQWLKRTRLFFILMGLILSSVLVAELVENIGKIQQRLQYSKILQGVQNIQSNYIELSALMLSAKYYDPTVRQNLKNRIVDTNQDIERSSIQIYSMDSIVEKYLNRPETVKSISTYSIAISNVTQMNDQSLNRFDEQSVLSNLALKIVPLFDSLINEKVSYLNSQLSSMKSLGMFVGFSLVLIGIFAWVYVTSKQILELKNNILKIMVKLNDNLLEKQLIKLLLFEEYLYYGKEIYEEDDLDYIMKEKKNKESEKQKGSQNAVAGGSKGMLLSTKKKIFQWKKRQSEDQLFLAKLNSVNLDQVKRVSMLSNPNDKNHSTVSTTKNEEEDEARIYVKKLVNPQKVNNVRIFTLVWVLVVGFFSFLFYRSIDEYSAVSKQIIKINYNLRKMHTSADTLWAMLNIFPYDLGLLESGYSQFFAAENEYRREVSKMLSERKFSREFVAFYEDIWMEDCCKYLQSQLPDCRKVIGGGLAEGASQIVSYMGRKYNFFMNVNMTASEFHSSQMTQELSTLVLDYLAKVVVMNVDVIQLEQNEFDNVFERQQFIYFTCVVIATSLILVVYKMLSKQNENLIKIQKLFRLIEFDSLKSNKQLKFYFKQNYYNQIYK